MVIDLKIIFNKKNVSMYKVSKLTGIPETTINAIANGKVKNPSFNSIVKISKALNIPLENFIGDDD